MTTINVDYSRGADVMRGSKAVIHFDGEDALFRAWLYIDSLSSSKGYYVRYWAL